MSGIMDVGLLVAGRLSKSVAGAADVTLTATEAQSGILEFTGVLTGAISVIFPATEEGAQYLVWNNTTGNYTLTVKVAGQTGFDLPQGVRAIAYCNGTDMVCQGLHRPLRNSKSVAGSGNITLTVAENAYRILEFTGVLTGSIEVYVLPTNGLEYVLYNGTTGAYTLTVKVSGQTGFLLTQGKRALGYTNGTDLVRATDDTA